MSRLCPRPRRRGGLGLDPRMAEAVSQAWPQLASRVKSLNSEASDKRLRSELDSKSSAHTNAPRGPCVRPARRRHLLEGGSQMGQT